MSPARRPRGLPPGAVALGGTARRVRLAGGAEVSRRQALKLTGAPPPEALRHPPRRPQRIADLSGRDRRFYGDALAVVREMREGRSLSAALAETNRGRPRGERLSPQRARSLLGPALRREGGRWRVSQHDSLPRRLNLLGPDGPRVVEVRGDRIASAIARYESAVGRWAAGDPRPLRKLRGRGVRLADGTVAPFITDEDVLRELARAGLLHLDDLYPPENGT